jgi:hypothetical protein
MQATFRIKVKIYWNKTGGVFELLDTSIDEQDEEESQEENDENNNVVEGIIIN